ncbi:MAG: DNA-processing protein DprA [Paludibacteraceae bacterium]|nr:DNA-processing protein DprA [Paludibacteraceae bacterium]
MDNELLYRIALTWLYRYRLRAARALLEQYGNAVAAWQHQDTVGQEDALKKAEDEIAFIQKHHISTYFYQDDNYPYRLRECPDAPLMLYGKGQLAFNSGKIVSIVGTRQATERGKEITRQLVLDLKAIVPDVTIVSGLAYGIDVAAHRAALEAGLPTIIIPAHGLDRIYPTLHRDVAIQALTQGGLLTEYTSGTEPEKMNFVARNRIVAGIADAVVVVESKERGGSLITARMAQDYGRDVFTFPGRIGDDASRGCNQLIRDNKAHLIENAEDLAYAMQWTDGQPLPLQTEIVGLTEPVTQEQQVLLDKLHQAEDGIHVNLLIMETGRAYSEVIADLMYMEMSGIVKELPGGIYRALK